MRIYGNGMFATEISKKQIGCIYGAAKRGEIKVEKWYMSHLYNLADYYGYDNNRSVEFEERFVKGMLEAFFAGDLEEVQRFIDDWTEKVYESYSRKNQAACDRTFIESDVKTEETTEETETEEAEEAETTEETETEEAEEAETTEETETEEAKEEEMETTAKFVFEEYDDKGGRGEEQVFDTLEDAKKEANYYWGYLTDREKKRYSHWGSFYRVFSITISEEDFKLWEDGELNAALGEYQDGAVYIDYTRVTNKFGKTVDFDGVVDIMDDDVRDDVHVELAPCSDQEFFDRYCELHRAKFGEEFEPNKKNGQY